MIYKIINGRDGQPFAVQYESNGVVYTIPFDPANTDYANFKREINEGTAQLQDADGNLMTAKEAKAYIATLP